jgi:hypothetical protein
MSYECWICLCCHFHKLFNLVSGLQLATPDLTSECNVKAMLRREVVPHAEESYDRVEGPGWNRHFEALLRKAFPESL